MLVTDFNYELPKHFIAQHPSRERDMSRLMIIYREDGRLEHRTFRELIDYLSPKDVLVLNNTKVIPARFYARRTTGGKVEILLLKPLQERLMWECMLKAKGSIKNKEEFEIAPKVSARAIDRLKYGQWIIELSCNGNFEKILEQYGKPPLPPYIKRKGDTYLEDDRRRYQTIYAENPGSVAAPTAGLHFSRDLLNEIKNKGVQIVYITLHIGLGTFQPVRAKKIEDHNMHAEFFELSDESAKFLNEAKANGQRIVAVGTSTVRALESAASESAKVTPFKGETSLFIYPGYRFNFVDAMITNFHLPCSTLLLLVSAFSGRDKILNAYEEATKRGYRFYSYGDAMLII